MLQSSVLFTGTQNLFNDLTTVLLIIVPILAVLLVIIFAVAKSGSDEMDQKKWQKRINNVIICAIIACLASVIVKLILNYYGVSA